MNVAEVAAIGLQRTAAGAPAQIVHEFDALVLRLLWRGASVPGALTQRAQSQQVAGVFGEFFAQQLAAQHSLGFGAMVLRALDAKGP